MADEQTPARSALEEYLATLEQEASPQLNELNDRVSGAVWDNIKDHLAVVFAGLWAGITGKTGDFVQQMGYSIGEEAKPGTDNILSGDVTKKFVDHATPEDAMRASEGLFEDHPFLRPLYAIYTAFNFLTGQIKAATSADWERMTQEVLKRKRPSIIPPEAVINSVYKFPESADFMKDFLARAGLDDTNIELFLQSYIEKLPPESARVAFLRELIDEVEHDDILRSYKLTDRAIEVLKQLYEIIPPVQDIITMAVREVFSPEIVERFGQLEGFPEDFGTWAKKLGLSDFWAHNYWAAHWNLPSALQGFEMLHRGVIGDDDLQLLLKALDVMPFWRDKLTEIAYNPLTRVDARRIHKLGLIDEDGLIKAYKDLGYNQENAEIMTDFTIAYNVDDERELTRTDIITLYKRKVISREDASTMLGAMGYGDVNIQLIITRADYEVEQEVKDKKIDAVKKQYIAGKIRETDVYYQLGRIDMPADEMNNLLATWDLEKQSKVRMFTYEQIAKLYGARLLNKTQTLGELKDLGYSDRDANLLIQLMDTGG